MERQTSEWTVRMLVDFESRINVEAEYQRGKVWSEAQQAFLIDSILRGFDIPKLFLSKRPDGSQHLFDVIDGKQRLTAIWRFVADEFALLRDLDPFPDLGHLGGQRWSDLSVEAKDRLQFANITVSTISDSTADEIRELFLRLQQGEPLNAAERRNAMAGPVRDFVAERLARHSVWQYLGLRSARLGLDEHAAILLALVQGEGPVGLKGADLYKLYASDDFSADGEVALRTLTLFGRLEAVARFKPRSIRTRWGLVDLFLALMRLETENREVGPETVAEFFSEFEEERRRVALAISDLQTRVVDLSVDGRDSSDEAGLSEGIAPEMLSYYLAFARDGATVENVATRSRILFDALGRFLDGQGQE